MSNTKKEKKKPGAYAIFTYLLTASFLPNVAVALIVGLASAVDATGLLPMLVAVASVVPTAYWGTRYASRYIRRKYLMDDSAKFVRNATITYGVLASIGVLRSFNDIEEIGRDAAVLSLTLTAMAVYFFYVFGLRWLGQAKASDIQSAQAS